MKTRTAAILLLLLIQPLASASAAVTNLQVDLTDPGAVLPNFTSNDLRIDSTGGLRGQQLVVQLTGGSLFNSGQGSNEPPSSALFPIFPDVQFDSFVALGGLTQETSHPILTAPGTLVPTCSSSPGCAFNIAWAPGTGIDVPAVSDFVVARITLSDDAAGVAYYYGESAASFGAPYFVTGTIQNGVISFVPEPTTLLAAASLFIGLSLFHRRRS